MSDLAQQIRDRLDAISAENDDDCTMQCGRSCADDGYDDVVAALLAVLELHACPEGSGIPGEVHCGELIDWVQGGCPTVRIIAEKLGIEATDGRA